MKSVTPRDTVVHGVLWNRSVCERAITVRLSISSNFQHLLTALLTARTLDIQIHRKLWSLLEFPRSLSALRMQAGAGEERGELKTKISQLQVVNGDR